MSSVRRITTEAVSAEPTRRGHYQTSDQRSLVEVPMYAPPLDRSNSIQTGRWPGEPTLEEILSNSIVLMLMDTDQVARKELEAALFEYFEDKASVEQKS